MGVGPLEFLADESWTFSHVTHALKRLAHCDDRGDPYYQPLCDRLEKHLTVRGIDRPTRAVTCITCAKELIACSSGPGRTAGV